MQKKIDDFTLSCRGKWVAIRRTSLPSLASIADKAGLDKVGRGIARIGFGGLASVAAGGESENEAPTVAFGYPFNQGDVFQTRKVALELEKKTVSELRALGVHEWSKCIYQPWCTVKLLRQRQPTLPCRKTRLLLVK